jgi:hypothetical protein
MGRDQLLVASSSKTTTTTPKERARNGTLEDQFRFVACRDEVKENEN